MRPPIAPRRAQLAYSPNTPERPSKLINAPTISDLPAEIASRVYSRDEGRCVVCSALGRDPRDDAHEELVIMPIQRDVGSIRANYLVNNHVLRQDLLAEKHASRVEDNILYRLDNLFILCQAHYGMHVDPAGSTLGFYPQLETILQAGAAEGEHLTDLADRAHRGGTVHADDWMPTEDLLLRNPTFQLYPSTVCIIKNADGACQRILIDIEISPILSALGFRLARRELLDYCAVALRLLRGWTVAIAKEVEDAHRFSENYELFVRHREWLLDGHKAPSEILTWVEETTTYEEELRRCNIEHGWGSSEGDFREI